MNMIDEQHSLARLNVAKLDPVRERVGSIGDIAHDRVRSQFIVRQSVQMAIRGGV
mgnify:CR=1 FL=1